MSRPEQPEGSRVCVDDRFPGPKQVASLEDSTILRCRSSLSRNASSARARSVMSNIETRTKSCSATFTLDVETSMSSIDSRTP